MDLKPRRRGAPRARAPGPRRARLRCCAARRSRSPASAARSATCATARQWQCERCGKRWDTRQIPAEQYEAIRRLQWRFRLVPIALGLVVAALAIFFTLTGNIFNVFVLLPLAMMIWFVFLRPTHQRRYRQAISDLPRWELRPQ